MAQPIRKMNKWRFFNITGAPYPLSPIPFNHFRRLLRKLKEKDNGNKTTRLKGALDFFWFGEGDNAMYLIVLCSKEFVNFVIHKFPLSLGSSGSF